MLLLAGGSLDPNIIALQNTAQARNLDVVRLYTEANKSPSFSWDVYNNHVHINGLGNPDINSCFLRQDVFESMESSNNNALEKCSNWFFSVYGWVQANRSINMLNRKAGLSFLNKPLVLHHALNIGMPIPFSLVTNELTRIKQGMSYDSLIAKPVNGGGYCSKIEDVITAFEEDELVTPCPAIVQNKLEYPEVRIYRIGSNYQGYVLKSKDLDYRKNQDVEIQEISSTHLKTEIQSLAVLTDLLGLDFAAADFKTCPKTKTLLFLELNNAPMFAAFDKVSKGTLANSILDYLTRTNIS